MINAKDVWIGCAKRKTKNLEDRIDNLLVSPLSSFPLDIALLSEEEVNECEKIKTEYEKYGWLIDIDRDNLVATFRFSDIIKTIPSTNWW